MQNQASRLPGQLKINAELVKIISSMKYFPPNPELFTRNRERYNAALLPGSIAIFVSNDEMPSNGDAYYPFRQSSDLFWLSGISQEGSMVILFPNHPQTRYHALLHLVRPTYINQKL